MATCMTTAHNFSTYATDSALRENAPLDIIVEQSLWQGLLYL